jgi:hypothetical protein
MFVFVELPVFQRAMEEVFGSHAEKAKLRDLLAFTDDALSSLMERLRHELMRDQASQLCVINRTGHRRPHRSQLR